MALHLHGHELRDLADVGPDKEESTAVMFADLDALPKPLHLPTTHALCLLMTYLNTGAFQIR